MRRLSSSDLVLLGCVLAWSVNFTVTKYALGHGFSPLSYAAPRFVIATTVFAAMALSRVDSLGMPRRDLTRVALWGALAISTNQVAFAWSFHFASATTVALLMGTLPIFAGIYAQAFGLERLGRRRWFAAAISFAGVALVALGAGGGVHIGAGGILLALYAPASFALYSITLSRYVGLYGTFRVNAVASLACLPILLAAASPELARTDWGAITPLAWAGLAYSAVLAYAITNLVWFVIVERVGAPRATVYANLQPFLGAVFALVLLSEPLGWLQVVGGVAIAIGIVLSRFRAAGRERASTFEASVPGE